MSRLFSRQGFNQSPFPRGARSSFPARLSIPASCSPTGRPLSKPRSSSIVLALVTNDGALLSSVATLLPFLFSAADNGGYGLDDGVMP
jgi:hypothetical protein